MAAFQHLNRETLADSVYTHLRDAIISGEVADGTELNQVALATQFNVSRVPVREALRRLQAERLVTVAPYQQYVVSAVKEQTLIELIELREQLEVFGVRRHIARLSQETLQQMRDMNAQLRHIEDKELWVDQDLQLHELMDGPGTETARMVIDLRNRVRRYLNTVASTRARQKQACLEHDRVITAMAARDSEAAEVALREHIGHTKKVIMGHAEGLAAAKAAEAGGSALAAK